MPYGKYFLIKNKSNNLVLEIEGSVDRSGVPVVLGRITSADHQLWYYDQGSFTIRNKLNNFCLDFKDDRILVSPHQRMRGSQHWQMDDTLLRARTDLELVVSLPLDAPTNMGTQAILSDHEPQNYKQHWLFIYCEAQFFSIRNQANDKILDVYKEDRKPGASVILYKNKENRSNNQLWYEDQDGFIRSKLNDYLLTADKDDDITLHPAAPRLSTNEAAKVKQGWMISGCFIQNSVDKDAVLEYRQPGGALTSFVSEMLVNPVLCRRKYDGKKDQQWFIDYVKVHSLNTTSRHTKLGKYCAITHKPSGMLLTAQGDGTIVLSLPKIDANGHHDTNQLWNVNDTMSLIQSATDKKCISLADDGKSICLVPPVNPTEDDAVQINWRFAGTKIHLQLSPQSVLTVRDDEPEDDTPVVMATFDDTPGQHWIKEHVPARCFYIFSYLNDRVIHVTSDTEHGSEGKLVMWDKYDDPSDEQLWYEDEQGLIRSMLNGYVPDAGQGGLYLRNYEAGKSSQQWIREADVISNAVDPQRVFDIKGRGADIGTPVCAFENRDQQNQKWYYRTETLEIKQKSAPQYFHLRSQLNNKVLTVSDGNPRAGTPVCMWDKLHPPVAHQLWYFTPDGALMSKLNRLAAVSSIHEVGRLVKMKELDPSDVDHSWKIDLPYLRNAQVHNLVMDIRKKNKKNGAEVTVFRLTSADNQKWHVDYI